MLGLPYNCPVSKNGVKTLVQEKLSSSLEDYLEVIYNFIEKNEKVRAIDISRELNVSRASVTEALKRLAEKDLIHYGRYDVISMTDEGKKLALGVIEKHNTLHYFFEEIMDLEADEACETACKIEHIISQNVLDRFTALKDFHQSHPDYIEAFKKYYREK